MFCAKDAVSIAPSVLFLTGYREFGKFPSQALGVNGRRRRNMAEGKVQAEIIYCIP